MVLPQLLQFLQPEVAVFDLHRRPDVHLDADQAVEAAIGRVVVDDQLITWPFSMWISVLPRMMRWYSFQSSFLMKDCNASRSPSDAIMSAFFPGALRHLAAQGEKGAAALFVILAGVAILAVDIGLVAAHHPLLSGHLDAAIVDAAVAAAVMR